MEEFIQGLSFKWQIKNIEKEKIQNLSNQLNLSNSIIEILYKRGFQNKEKIQDFLFFYYDEKFYHTSKMEDAEDAVERIIKAINEKESILICGDYDVDGISSTSLLLYSLLMLEANVNFFLPDRVHDGYGLSKKTIEKAIKNKYKLIITVDNGI